jgi:plasmid stability protein
MLVAVVYVRRKGTEQAMIVDLPESLEAALKVQANAHGVTPEGYVCGVLERVLGPGLQGQSAGVSFKTGRGASQSTGTHLLATKSTRTGAIC